MANITEKQKANLKPLNTLSQSKRKEIARKGALASNKKQAEKRKMREEFEIISKLVQDGKTYQEIACLAQYKKAMAGDTRALEFIRDVMGEKPIEQIEHKEIDTLWYL
jgi:ribosomal protein L9